MNAENYALAWSAHLTEIKTGLVALQEQCQMQDVTLAADGQHVNAHKLVLAICSDYFRDVFSANPTNSTHAIVILKDISHTALSYIIQFMYTGEISIPADTLTEFLTAARVLRVKGLMSGEEKIIKDKHQVPQLKPKRKAPSQPITNLKYRPGPKSRKTTKRVVTYGSKPSKTYPKPIIDSSNIKVEKEDLDDVPSSSSVPDIKPDLDNNMIIDYEYNGIEGSLKNDVGVVNEMDSQGEAVDESCYTNGPGLKYIRSPKGKMCLVQSDHIYWKQTNSGTKVFWKCSQYHKTGCRGRCVTRGNTIVKKCSLHNHPPLTDKVIQSELEGSVFYM